MALAEDQLGLFDARPAPESHDEPAEDDTLAARFERFHAANPQVYRRLVELARAARVDGRKVGIGMLFEVLRFEEIVRTRRTDQFRLNNNHRAFYARLIMEREADLAGVFETRDAVADGEGDGA